MEVKLNIHHTKSCWVRVIFFVGLIYPFSVGVLGLDPKIRGSKGSLSPLPGGHGVQQALEKKIGLFLVVFDPI